MVTGCLHNNTYRAYCIMSYISNYNTVKHGERGTVKDYVRLSSCVLMLHRSMVARAGEAGLAVLHKFFSFHEGRGVGGVLPSEGGK